MRKFHRACFAFFLLWAMPFAAQTKIVPHSKVFVAPMGNGLDGALSAQIIQQKVPLQIVTDQNQADYILTGQATATGETQKGMAGGSLWSIINPQRQTTQYDVSVKIESVSLKVVVWASGSDKHDVKGAAKDIARKLKRDLSSTK